MWVMHMIKILKKLSGKKKKHLVELRGVLLIEESESKAEQDYFSVLLEKTNNKIKELEK